MGASQDKMHCTRYLDGQGPPTLAELVQADTQGPKNSKNPLIKQGNQPNGGQLTWDIERRSLPGHPKHDTIRIIFHFDDGIQSDTHPHPGHGFRGGDCVVYLPQDSDGSRALRLLEQAFQNKLLFTVAADNSGEYCVTPADIPLKTNPTGGPASSGYPDPAYLKTLKKTLKLKGIQ